jgi:hypothetical protein
MRVKLDEVPLDVRRRAARHLEAVRGTPMAAGADAAQLGDEACPVFRPDVKGVAYWELEIVGVKTATRARPGANGRPAASDRGFVVVSTGAHDVPVPHWSVELEPPSRSLEARAGDKPVARVVKLDTLAYACENAKGAYLAHIGQFPPMPAGLPSALPKAPAQSSLESRPASATPSDRRVAKQEVKRTGARAPRPKLVPWPSWAQAKKRYASAYKLHLAALRARAAQAWQIEELVAKLGEGIHEGDRLVVPLLKPGKASLSGDGVQSVTMRMIDRNPPAVELLAGGAAKQAEQQFQLQLSYADGTSETLIFFVVPKGTPSNRRTVLPHPVPVLTPRP